MILIHIFSLIFRLVKYILHSLFSGHSKTHKPAHIQNKRCRFFVFFFPLSDNIPDTHYKLLHSHRHLKPFWTERIPSIGVTKDKSESGKGVLRGIIDRYNWHDIRRRVKIFGNAKQTRWTMQQNWISGNLLLSGKGCDESSTCPFPFPAKTRPNLRTRSAQIYADYIYTNYLYKVLKYCTVCMCKLDNSYCVYHMYVVLFIFTRDIGIFVKFVLKSFCTISSQLAQRVMLYMSKEI